MNNSILDDIDKSSSRDISTFYSFNGDKSTYVFFVSDSKNIYIETHRGAIIIPYEHIAKYNKLYAYYIISQQITSRQPKIYYCNTGYKGIYKEHRNWYIMSNIYWKSMNMSYGDYCYFKDNPNNIDLYNCNTIEDIASFIIGFNDSEQDPSKISDWLINYEINCTNSEEMSINYIYFIIPENIKGNIPPNATLGETLFENKGRFYVLKEKKNFKHNDFGTYTLEDEGILNEINNKNIKYINFIVNTSKYGDVESNEVKVSR
jgi:hypothetical protein